jgi:hypothetical protein
MENKKKGMSDLKKGLFLFLGAIVILAVIILIDMMQ